MTDGDDAGTIRPIVQLLGDGGDADAELALLGQTAEQAEQAIDAMLADPPAAARTVAIRLDPPAGDGRETLFQPVGRHLKAAIADGRVSTIRPIASDGAVGFVGTLPGPAH